MKYKTHNDNPKIDSNGTYFQGEIEASYAHLCELFGNPTNGDEYKTDAEWEVEFEDGTVATIYNWKDGKNYNGPEGMETEDITNWHIGGHDKKAVERVREIMSKTSSLTRIQPC